MKVIKIDGNKVYIGFNNGKFKTAPLSAFNFPPAIGDEIEVFKSGNEVIFSLKKSARDSSGAETMHGMHQETVNYDERPVNPHLVNKMAYALLAIFLGGFGIHKFYANRTGMGLLYLVFC